jgi:hypothetical protein
MFLMRSPSRAIAPAIDDLAGFLMVEVRPLIADAAMGFGHQQIGPAAVLAAGLLMVTLALTLRQHRFVLSEEAGIVDVAPVGQGGEIVEPWT